MPPLRGSSRVLPTACGPVRVILNGGAGDSGRARRSVDIQRALAAAGLEVFRSPSPSMLNNQGRASAIISSQTGMQRRGKPSA